MELYVLFGMLLAAAAGVAVFARSVLWKATDWHPHVRWRTAKPVQLIDGTTTRDPVLMRKKAPNGHWVYRRMSDVEHKYYRPDPE